MKSIKIYLIVVTILLIGAICFGIFVWFKIQTLQTHEPAPVTSSEKVVTPTSATGGTSSTSAQKTEPAPIVISTDSMTATQKKTLETLGYTQDTFTITSGMISCAEGNIGKDRVAEIVAGAAPSPLESVKLLPCLKK